MRGWGRSGASVLLATECVDGGRVIDCRFMSGDVLRGGECVSDFAFCTGGIGCCSWSG